MSNDTTFQADLKDILNYSNNNPIPPRHQSKIEKERGLLSQMRQANLTSILNMSSSYNNSDLGSGVATTKDLASRATSIEKHTAKLRKPGKVRYKQF